MGVWTKNAELTHFPPQPSPLPTYSFLWQGLKFKFTKNNLFSHSNIPVKPFIYFSIIIVRKNGRKDSRLGHVVFYFK